MNGTDWGKEMQLKLGRPAVDQATPPPALHCFVAAALLRSGSIASTALNTNSVAPASTRRQSTSPWTASRPSSRSTSPSLQGYLAHKKTHPVFSAVLAMLGVLSFACRLGARELCRWVCQ